MSRSFFVELKRRNVLRAMVLYAGAVWALSQGVSQLSPALGLPDYATRWFLIACAIGFPFWLAFAWFYEFTPQGFKRESEIAEDAPARHSNARKLDFAIIGVLIVAVALLASGYFVHRDSNTNDNAIAAKPFNPPAGTIAVLPFANESGDPKQQYFSDGITEELTNALGQNAALTVIAWDTASHYRNGSEGPQAIGKALNVANLLHGSIQREGDQVRVVVELVNTRTGAQIWSNHYDDTLANVFQVQDKISAAIAEALQVKFASLGTAPTLNPQAHELYLKGLAALDRFTAADVQAAQDYFQQALKLDPNYADAWAGLARTYVQLSEVSTLPLKDALPKIRAAAQKALALEPHNVNALVELGGVDLSDHHVAQARKEYQRALEIDPNNARAHLDYGTVLPLKLALAQTQEAARLDPDNATAQNNLAVNYWDLSDWPQLVAASQGLNKLSPHDIDAAFGLAFAYTQMQRGAEAVKAFDLVQPSTALDKQLADAGRLTYQALLKPELRTKALAALDSVRRAKISPYSQGDVMQLYLALGEKATAMQMLPDTCAATPLACSDLAVNPIFAPLHGDPRFEKLAKQYTTVTLE